MLRTTVFIAALAAPLAAAAQDLPTAPYLPLTMAAKAAHIHHVPIDSMSCSVQKQKRPAPEGHRPLHVFCAHGPCPLGKVSLATESLPEAPGGGLATGLP